MTTNEDMQQGVFEMEDGGRIPIGHKSSELSLSGDDVSIHTIITLVTGFTPEMVESMPREVKDYFENHADKGYCLALETGYVTPTRNDNATRRAQAAQGIGLKIGEMFGQVIEASIRDVLDVPPEVQVDVALSATPSTSATTAPTLIADMEDGDARFN